MSYIVAIKALSVFYLLSSRCSMVYPLTRMYRHLPAFQSCIRECSDLSYIMMAY
jgi:hypothetical protein